MNALQFWIGLRKKLKSEISGVEDATSWRWGTDRTRDNWTTRRVLTTLVSDVLSDLKQQFAIIEVRRFSCTEPEVESAVLKLGGWKDNAGFLYRTVPNDSRFFQKEVNVDHFFDWGYKDPDVPASFGANRGLLSLTDQNALNVAALASVLQSIEWAISNAGDRKPRSGIREELLLAVLEIEDEIFGSRDEAVARLSSMLSDNS